ncbi:MAG: type II toxin-antitoxin system VapC family toxin [Synechococcales cyanobacterium CRU_2_2]|nr:type II toxin-antitoxin system VapC family toxin [Synechococcales cyanobacterium CRU_2_2]
MITQVLGRSPSCPQNTNVRLRCAKLLGLGQVPSFLDGQIAAVAQINSLILVTRNVSDYQGFVGLQIENWFCQFLLDPPATFATQSIPTQ